MSAVAGTRCCLVSRASRPVVTPEGKSVTVSSKLKPGPSSQFLIEVADEVCALGRHVMPAGPYGTCGRVLGYHLRESTCSLSRFSKSIGTRRTSTAALVSCGHLRHCDSLSPDLFRLTGLGLVISQNLARLMRGDVTLSSPAGGGTVAVVELPLRPPSGPLPFLSPAAPTSSPNVISRTLLGSSDSVRSVDDAASSASLDRRRFGSASSTSSLPGASTSSVAVARAAALASLAKADMGLSSQGSNDAAARAPRVTRLIIAEDTASSRRLIESMVERLGGQSLRENTVFATNGREALNAFQAAGASVQLVILDMHMPEMDGHAACKAIRDVQRTLSRSCPVLALSADAFSDQRERALESGFSGYLTKPLTLSQFHRVLEDHMPDRVPSTRPSARRTSASTDLLLPPTVREGGSK
jgi:CheY-like chemotaxis protein